MSEVHRLILRLLNEAVAETAWPRRVYLCGRHTPPPPLSHMVNFPRLEIPLAGIYENEIEHNRQVGAAAIQPGEALFAPSNCWNRPTWRRPVRLLSVLFGRRQLGFSLVTNEGTSGSHLLADKYALSQTLTGPGLSIIEALSEFAEAGIAEQGLSALVRSLVYCVIAVLDDPAASVSRARRRLEEICVYLQTHYQYEITRDSVAKQFGVTPNHLSRLFKTVGHMKFAQYLTFVRVDRAKFLLKSYPMRLTEISRQCGYNDTAYFCRVFRKITRLTPSEYRRGERR